jgi:hypothetical protein
MIWAIVWKYKYWIAIAIFFFLWVGQIAYTNHLSRKLQKTETVCDARIAKAIEPYQTAIAKAEQQKTITEKAWSDKYIEVERNAIKKIQDANASARSAELANNGLSKQLSEANQRLSTATHQTIVEYSITNSELLEACTAEYRSMAEKADGHAIDVERLSGVWPEEKALK